MRKGNEIAWRGRCTRGETSTGREKSNTVVLWMDMNIMGK